MRKGTGVFKKIEETKIVCDECGNDVDMDYYIHVDGHWSDGYDTYGDYYDFCSLNCTVKHLQIEHLPPENEDMSFDIPVKFLNIILSKLTN